MRAGSHNEWDPAIKQVERDIPPDLQMRYDAGNAFEDEILDELKASMTPRLWVDLSDVRGKGATIAETLSAMESRVAMILGGWLPDDEAGGRTGKPDLLLHVGEVHELGDNTNPCSAEYKNVADALSEGVTDAGSLAQLAEKGCSVSPAQAAKSMIANGATVGPAKKTAPAP